MRAQVELRKLAAADAEALSAAIRAAPAEYARFFTPFAFDAATLRAQLARAREDVFVGLFVGDEVAGFYMLRGFDEGYETPAYGVWIAPRFSGRGLAQLTLAHAIAFCRVHRIPELMLKVHPENLVAKELYERHGFRQVGVDAKNQNLVYKKKLS